MTKEPSDFDESNGEAHIAALRYRRLNELFSQCTKLAPDDRKKYLDDVCGSDVELKAEVLTLLRADRDATTGSDLLLNAVNLDHFLAENRETERRWETHIPKQVGNYRVVRLIATGGMGAVYEGVRIGDFDQRVAIKVLRHGFQSQELLRRFGDEVRFLAVLGEHANIAGLLDAGSMDEGVPFLVMQFVDGERIDEHCDRQRLTIRERLRLFLQVCEAVQFAHQNTVIHRDLKPNNILVNGDGACQLIDFGIAKLIAPQPQLQESIATETRYRVFTPEYASPEQFRGEQLTTASDVYSLGVVLYELLSGCRPFPTPPETEKLGLNSAQRTPEYPSKAISRNTNTKQETEVTNASIEMVSQNRSEQPRRLQRELSGDLDNIALMALRHEPNRRYASAEHLAADIQRHLNGLPVLARKDTLRYRLEKFVYRQRLAVISSALILIAVIGGLVGVYVQWRKAEVARAAAVRSTQEADLQKQLALDAVHLARWQHYRANITAALAAQQRADTTLVSRLLQEAPVEFRNWEWHYLRRQLDRSAKVLPGYKDNHCEAAFNSTGQLMATVVEGNEVRILDSHSQEEITILRGHTDVVWSVQFGLNDTRIATRSRDNTTRLWNAENGEEIAVLGNQGKFLFSPSGTRLAVATAGSSIRIYETSGGSLVGKLEGRYEEGIAFSPDGSLLAAGSRYEGTIQIWDLSKLAVAKELHGHTAGVSRLVFSPDSRRLFSGSFYPESEVRVWDLESGSTISRMASHENSIASLACNSDGSRIVSASFDQTLRLWNGKGELVSVLRGHRSGIRSLQISPNNTLIASASDDNNIMLWNGHTGELVNVLQGHTDEVAFVDFSADSTMLLSASSDGTIRLWDVERMSQDNLLTGHTSFVYGVAVAPFENHIASSAWDGTVRIWDLDTERVLTVLDGVTDNYRSIAYSPDGKRIVCGTGDGTAHVWNLTNQSKRVIGNAKRVNLGQVTPVAFSPDGDSIAILDGDRNVVVWDLSNETKKVYQEEVETDPIGSVAISPSGDQILVGTSATVQSWNLETGKRSAVFHGMESRPGTVRAITFSADGNWLAFGGLSRMVHVFDWETREKVVSIQHPGFVYSIAFTPDRTRMACGCQDNTIRIWDTKTWQLVAELGGHKEYVHSLAFTNDGKTLVSCSGDFTVRLWHGAPALD